MHPLSHNVGLPRHDRATGERGVVVVLVALSMVAVLLVVMLVLDGSQAYPQRRRAQNAADAAALAGARTLDKRMWFGGTEEVGAVVKEVVAENGVGFESCEYINATGGDLGDCEATGYPAGTAGVRVHTVEKRNKTFGGLTGGPDQVEARAHAAATVQKLAGVGSPFVVCGSDDAYPNPSPPGRDLLVLNPDGSTFLRPDGTAQIDEAKALARGKFAIQGSEPFVPNCGAGSQFDGVNDDDEVSIPGWVEGGNGNGFDARIEQQVLGATPCPYPVPNGMELACDVILPIADRGEDGRLYAVAFAVFHITGNGKGNPKYWAEYRAQLNYVSGGTTNTDLVGENDLRVIRLIE